MCNGNFKPLLLENHRARIRCTSSSFIERKKERKKEFINSIQIHSQSTRTILTIQSISNSKSFQSTKMKLCLTHFVTPLVLFSLLLRGTEAKPKTKIAIARPFSLSDASKLPATFDAWNLFPPCLDTPAYSADLLLFFSGSFKKSSGIVDIINEVGSIYTKTSGWGDCIDKVVAIGCDIKPSTDINKPQEFQTNPLWVNGPNRQFERSVRALQQSSGESYDFLYLMGLDSNPIKSNWLGAFVDEIENTTRGFVTMRR